MAAVEIAVPISRLDAARPPSADETPAGAAAAATDVAAGAEAAPASALALLAADDGAAVASAPRSVNCGTCSDGD